MFLFLQIRYFSFWAEYKNKMPVPRVAIQVSNISLFWRKYFRSLEIDTVI